MDTYMPRLSASMALGCLVTILFHSVGTQISLAITYWLIYILASGVILNSTGQVPMRARVILSGISPLSTIATVLAIMVLYGVDDCWLSGVKCDASGLFFFRAFFVWFVSFLGIWIATYAHHWLFAVFDFLGEFDEEKRNKVSAIVAWLTILIPSIFALIAIIAFGPMGES